MVLINKKLINQRKALTDLLHKLQQIILYLVHQKHFLLFDTRYIHAISSHFIPVLFFPVNDFTYKALHYLFVIYFIHVAHKLNLNGSPVSCFESQIFVTIEFFLIQF
jgi:hypothetical protein